MISFEAAELKVRDIKAHCGPVQGRWLFDLVRNCTPKDSFICEIGTFYGYMTAFLGLACDESNRRVVAIDHFIGEFCDHDHDPFFYKNFIDNLLHVDVWEKVVPFVAKSFDAFPYLEKSDIRFNLIYLDGDHSFDTVYKELELFTTLLNVGGFICGDDCGTNVVPFDDIWNGLKSSSIELHNDVVGAVYEFFKDNTDFEVMPNVPASQFGFKRIK